MIVQDLTVIPGFEKQFGGAAMMKLHDLAVKQVSCLSICVVVPLLD